MGKEGDVAALLHRIEALELLCAAETNSSQASFDEEREKLEEQVKKRDYRIKHLLRTIASLTGDSKS